MQTCRRFTGGEWEIRDAIMFHVYEKMYGVLGVTKLEYILEPEKQATRYFNDIIIWILSRCYNHDSAGIRLCITDSIYISYILHPVYENVQEAGRREQFIGG